MKLETIIEKIGGNTDELKTNLDTEKYDYIIEYLGGNINELETNLITEKKEKIKELLGITIKFDSESEFLDYLVELYPELEKVVVEGENIEINDSTASNCSIEILGKAEQEVITGASLLDFSKPYTITNAEVKFENDILVISTETTKSYDGPRYDILEIVKANPGKTLRLDYESINESNPANNTAIGTLNLKIAGQNIYHTFIGKAVDDYIPASAYYTIPNDVNEITNAIVIIFTNNSSTRTDISNTVTITKPILHFGTERIEYERYSNGFSGPSPECPCKIKTIKGNCEVVIENEGKTRKQIYELTIPKQYELVKIGEYKDYYYKENGKWYKYKNIKEIIVDGSIEDITLNTEGTKTTRVGFWRLLDESAITVLIDNPQIISTHLIGKQMWSEDAEGIYANESDLVIRINKEIIGSTPNTVKKWLLENPINVYYVLKTPIIEEITDKVLIGQLNSLANARTYYGTTYINTEADINPTIKVTYKQIKG